METYCATGFFEILFLGFWVDGEKDKSDVFIWDKNGVNEKCR